MMEWVTLMIAKQAGICSSTFEMLWLLLRPPHLTYGGVSAIADCKTGWQVLTQLNCCLLRRYPQCAARERGQCIHEATDMIASAET